MWYTLSDITASKILTGKMPKIEDAITFIPIGKQNNLRKIEILKGMIRSRRRLY